MAARTITLPPANDLHVHLRQDDDLMLANVVRHTARRCARCLVMPNTQVPVTTAEHVERDFRKIRQLAGYTCPLMTIKVDARTTSATVRAARAVGCVAGKIYPEGVTTNSESGITRQMFRDMPSSFRDALGEMERCGMVLCLHGEMPGEETLDREGAFLPWVERVLSDYPRLLVVLEHVSTADAVHFVIDQPGDNLAATITAHHLVLTLDDIIGDRLNPHAFCKPVPKFRADREALREAATGGHPRFFLGSDSAPHLRANKECAAGCAGVFSAPVLLEVLAEVFEECGALHALEWFTTRHGEQFYRLPPVDGTVTLERESWHVPDVIDGVVPFCASRRLNWRVC